MIHYWKKMSHVVNFLVCEMFKNDSMYQKLFKSNALLWHYKLCVQFPFTFHLNFWIFQILPIQNGLQQIGSRN